MPDTGDDPGSTNGETGNATDTGGAPILCPLIERNIHIDGDGLPDTVLESQDDVALLAGCTDISGPLRIDSTVSDLTPLASLRRIAGSLCVNTTAAPGIPPAMLTSLQGLEGLESVRRVELRNLVVPNLDPLAGLTNLAGGLTLERLTQIESLAVLHNLHHIGGPLSIAQADKLTDLQALAGLTEILDTVELVDLRALPSLEGLHNLDRVGSLRIDECPLLADLDGLRGLQRVDEGVVLKQLSLTDLHGLEGKFQLLYLPTYRRVELSVPKVPRRATAGRRLREPESTDGIRYGLRDVQDRLAEILADIQRYSNSQYRTISAAIIDDALGGKINPNSHQFETLPDIDALRLFFSRVESDQSKNDRLESLKHLYETGEINQPDQLILRYFLSKLKAVVDRIKQLEANVEKFVEQVNVYWSLSSDEKTLTYDSNLMKVVVRNVFNGDEIDLEALSSGEKQVISLFSHLYLESGQKIVLIDEPELSLSLDWQKRLLPDVITSPGCAQLLAITHSPSIFDNDLDRYAGPMQIRRQGEASQK